MAINSGNSAYSNDSVPDATGFSMDSGPIQSSVFPSSVLQRTAADVDAYMADSLNAGQSAMEEKPIATDDHLLTDGTSEGAIKAWETRQRQSGQSHTGGKSISPELKEQRRIDEINSQSHQANVALKRARQAGATKR